MHIARRCDAASRKTAGRWRASVTRGAPHGRDGPGAIADQCSDSPPRFGGERRRMARATTTHGGRQWELVRADAARVRRGHRDADGHGGHASSRRSVALAVAYRGVRRGDPAGRGRDVDRTRARRASRGRCDVASLTCVAYRDADRCIASFMPQPVVRVLSVVVALAWGTACNGHGNDGDAASDTIDASDVVTRADASIPATAGTRRSRSPS